MEHSQNKTWIYLGEEAKKLQDTLEIINESVSKVIQNIRIVDSGIKKRENKRKEIKDKIESSKKRKMLEKMDKQLLLVEKDGEDPLVLVIDSDDVIKESPLISKPPPNIQPYKEPTSDSNSEAISNKSLPICLTCKRSIDRRGFPLNLNYIKRGGVGIECHRCNVDRQFERRRNKKKSK